MLIIKKSKATVLELIIKLMTLLTIIPVFLIIGYSSTLVFHQYLGVS